MSLLSGLLLRWDVSFVRGFILIETQRRCAAPMGGKIQ